MWVGRWSIYQVGRNQKNGGQVGHTIQKSDLSAAGTTVVKAGSAEVEGVTSAGTCKEREGTSPPGLAVAAIYTYTSTTRHQQEASLERHTSAPAPTPAPATATVSSSASASASDGNSRRRGPQSGHRYDVMPFNAHVSTPSIRHDREPCPNQKLFPRCA